MDLNAARMFVHVVQAGSLSAAGERSRVPLPTLSRRIRELERELKVQLFERSTRGARLTDAGTRLYEFALRGIETLAEGEQAVMSDQARLKGRLRLSVPPAMEPWWVLLQDFQERYPDIELSIYATERRVELIEDGIDVALRIGNIADETLIARRIISYRHVLVAPPSLIGRLGAPKTVEDLGRYPCAAWVPAIGVRRTWKLGKETFEPKPILATNDYLQLRSHALNAGLMTELPPFLAKPFVADGSLRVLLDDQPFPEQTAHLVYPSHRYPSTLVRAYLEFCRTKAAKYF